MPYPSQKTHRRNRRKLGKNQVPNLAAVTVAVSSTGTTNVTLTFSQPVVVSGHIGNTVATKTLVSQTTVSPTVVTQVWSGNVTGEAYTVPSNDPSVRGVTGGLLVGTSGTFP